MLKLDNINVSYGNIQVLWDLSLEIQDGEIVCLIGANGAGKSTTLLSICGINSILSGSIFYKNSRIDGLSSDKILKKGICLVPEGRHIFNKFNVYENIMIGAYIRKDKKKIKDDFELVIELFPRLKERLYQIAGTLSGGEQQMLAIARALMSNPDLLLLDEPSLGLAPVIIKNLFNIIKKINQEKKTSILLIEQNAHLALLSSSRGYVIENGVMAFSGSSDLLLKDERLKQAYLGI